MPYKNKEDVKRCQEAVRSRNKLALLEYLLVHSCVDCGENDPVVLEFDHVYGKKKFNIGRAVSASTRSWTSILTEIAKCEVRCANCHRRQSAKRGGYWKVLTND